MIELPFNEWYANGEIMMGFQMIYGHHLTTPSQPLPFTQKSFEKPSSLLINQSNFDLVHME
jgi:hypothetical protein